MALSLPLNILVRNDEQTDKPPSAFRPFDKRPNTLEVLGASYALAFEDTYTQIMLRKAKNFFGEEDTDIVDQKELNKMFPEIEVPFNKPTSLSLAKDLSLQARKRRELQKVISEGSDGSTLMSIAQFGMGMGAQFVDPVGMAIGLSIGAGMGRIVGKAILGTGISRAAKLRVLKGAVPTALFNGVGNVIEEVGISTPLLRQEQKDVNVWQNAAFAFGAGVGFTAVGRTWGHFKKRKMENAAAKAVVLAEAQMENGNRLHVEPLMEAELSADAPKIRQELDEARRANQPEEVITELENDLRTAEDAVMPDRATEAQKANNPDQSLAYDQKAVDDLKQGEIDLFEADRGKEFESQFDDIRDTINDLKAREDISPELEKVFKDVETELNQLDQVDEMARIATSCVR